jgi:peptide/nickel transport system substrate-binding protein
MRRLLIVVLVWWLGGAYAATLTVALTTDPVSLDPHAINDVVSAQAMRQIYDTLVVQTEALELVPGLAESWEQLDEVTWEFRLREGVTFHNGDPLTAGDVVFSFNRLRDPATGSPGAFVLGFVEAVEATDELTVRVTTQYPFAPILAHLSLNPTSILSERAVSEAGEAYGTEVAVGTGPFSLVRWEVAQQLELARNPDWWGGEVGAERLVFRPIVETSVRAIELELGAVDIAYGLGSEAARLEENPAVTLLSGETLGTDYIGFNTQKEPFDDARVRQAVHHAVDIDAIIEAVYQGQAVRAQGPISPQVFGALALETYDYDPERARALLAEAGYPEGVSVTIWTNNTPRRIEIAEILQSYLAEVGIAAEVEVFEWGAYLAGITEGRHQMILLGWITVTGDADYGLYGPFHSSQHGVANRVFYTNARVDELIDLGRQESDPELRAAHYAEAQQLIVEDAPWVFVAVPTETIGVRAGLSGFVPHPSGMHRLYQAALP